MEQIQPKIQVKTSHFSDMQSTKRAGKDMYKRN